MDHHPNPTVDTEPDVVGGFAAHRETGDTVPAALACTLDAVPLDDHDSVVVLRMVGEIDLATQAGMRTGLRYALQARPRHLLVDLSGVRFCSAYGFGRLTDTASRAAAHDIGYALCGLPPHLRRIATALWGRAGPVQYRSLATAVTTLRAAQARTPRAHRTPAGFSARCCPREHSVARSA